MDKAETRTFIDQAVEATLAALEARADDLRGRGIAQVVEQDGSIESVELTVYFYRGAQVVDVLECFLTQDGRPATSLAELNAWLVSSIDDVLARDDLRV